MKTGRLVRLALLNQSLALSAEFWCCQNASPWKLFDPRLVTTWICMAPWPVLSAPRFDVVTVTSCTCSSRLATKLKKLVPPLLKRCALFEIPSCVMLIEAPGIPSKVLSRAVTPCCAPVVSSANGSASRPGRGRSCRYFCSTVFEIVVLDRWSTGAAPATSTVAPTDPTFRLTGWLVVRAALTTISVYTAVSNPFMVAVSRYAPGWTDGNTNPPSWAASVCCATSVAIFSSCSATPGTTAPEASCTRPTTCPVVATWACADQAKTAMKITHEDP